MLHVQVQKKKRGFAGYLLSFLIFFAVLFFSLFCMNAMQRRSEEESLMSLRDAIRRASVQCYAIEGRAIRQAWNIWKSTMESSLTETAIMYSTTAGPAT